MSRARKIRPDYSDVGQHVIPDLQSIMYNYARPATVNDVLYRALRYLQLVLKEKGAVEVFARKYVSSFKVYNRFNIQYTEKDCDNCGGIQGCFSIKTYSSGPSLPHIKICTTSETVAYIHENILEEIESVSMSYGHEFGLLYEKFDNERNVLNRGYFLNKNVPLPKDF